MGHYDCSNEPVTVLYIGFSRDSANNGFTMNGIDSFYAINLFNIYSDTVFFKDLNFKFLIINPIYDDEDLRDRYHYIITNYNKTRQYEVRVESIETGTDKGRCIDCYYLIKWSYSVNGNYYEEYNSNAWMDLTKNM